MKKARERFQERAEEDSPPRKSKPTDGKLAEGREIVGAERFTRKENREGLPKIRRKTMKEYDVAVIGGGPAGMAAAAEAAKNGAETLVIERDGRQGGILNQCIHNGFGLHLFGEELTGPEFAQRFIDEVAASGAKVMTGAFVVEIREDKTLVTVSPSGGVEEIKAKAVVLAMGARERSAGAIGLTGSRPDGIWTAGLAQRLCNVEGMLVGKKIVILGSGDIGLIMARRMTCEGAEVRMVCEIMPYSGGLKRNIVQCLDDFGIPLLLSTTVTRVVGKKRVEGVYIADIKDGKPLPETERFVECDTLLLSVGLIPETDLLSGSGIETDRATGSFVVNEFRETSLPGIFACGNVLHIHDLVDNVADEGFRAGRSAADYALRGRESEPRNIPVKAGKGIKYVLPQRIDGEKGKATIYFRTDNVYARPTITVRCGEKVVAAQKKAVTAPGEMQSVAVDTAKIDGEVVVEITAGEKR